MVFRTACTQTTDRTYPASCVAIASEAFPESPFANTFVSSRKERPSPRKYITSRSRGNDAT